MEPLSRIFPARAWAVLLPTFFVVGVELLLWVVVPFGWGLATIAGALMIAGTLAFSCGVLLSRLHVSAGDGFFSMSIRLFGCAVFRREVNGRSWHVISFPPASIDAGSNDFVPYRIEVVDDNGDRILVMGKLCGYIYGVDCL